jgi:hypothetical protein
VIKLKAEYGTALNWVLPYPGDWHILKKNIDCSVSCIGMEKNVFTPGTTIFFPCKRVLVKPYLKMPLLNFSHDANSELIMSKSARHKLENLL